MFSGFGPFGRNPIAGKGLPQDTSSLPQSSSGPGASKDEPTGDTVGYQLVGSQKSASIKDEGKTGLNRVHYDPVGYDVEKGFVNGAKLCGHDQIYGPFKQTRFLGASVTSFSSSVGFNNGTSNLDVTLVEDPCEGNIRTWYTRHRTKDPTASYYVDTDNLLMYNRTDLIEKNDIEPDEFSPPEIGSPVYFRMGSFEYCGLLQSHQRLESSNGMPTFSAKVTDPRELFDGVSIILSEERGDLIATNDFTHDKPEDMWNVWNVYQLLEQLGENGNNCGGAGGFCYGGSELTSKGVPWNNIRQALKIYGAGFKHETLESTGEQDPLVAITDFTRNNYGIRYKDARIYLDIEELPEIEDLRIQGPVTSLLDLIGVVCEYARRDFWVELLPVQIDDTYSYGSADQEDSVDFVVRSLPDGTFIGPGLGIALFAKVRTIDRNIAPKIGPISQFVETYKASGLIIDSSVGLEGITEPTNIVLIGGKQTDVYQCERPHQEPDDEDYTLAGIVVNKDDASLTDVGLADAFRFYDNYGNDTTVHVGAAAVAYNTNGRDLPVGVQPYWGFHENGDLIIGNLYENPFKPNKVVKSDGTQAAYEDLAETDPIKIQNPEKIYTISVATKNLTPRLFRGNLVERYLTGYTDSKGENQGSPSESLREWGSEGDSIHHYHITEIELRAAKTGFNEWKSLIATNEFHPVTMTYKLQGAAAIAKSLMQVLTKKSDGGFEGEVSDLGAQPIQKALDTLTGVVNADNANDAEKEEQRKTDLDLRTIHEWVLSFANRAGRQFLVPLFTDNSYSISPSISQPQTGSVSQEWVDEAASTTLVTPGPAVLGKAFLKSGPTSMGHYRANLCTYRDGEVGEAFPSFKITDRATVSSQPSKGDGGPFLNRGAEDHDSVLMLPHPGATSFFQDDVGLLRGFCRFGTHEYTSGGYKRVAKIENINERDIFYHGGLYADVAGEATGIWVSCDYSSDSQQDNQQGIVYVNKHYTHGPYTIASIPAPVLKEEPNLDLPKLLRLLMTVLTSSTSGEKISISKEVIDEIRELINLSQGGFGLEDSFLLPDAFAVPIESNIYRYGPFLSEPTGIAGITKTFDESADLVPWNFGGVQELNTAASGLANQRKATAEVAEIGSVRIPGLPSGATLGFELDSIGNARGALVYDFRIDDDGNEQELPARYFTVAEVTGVRTEEAPFLDGCSQGKFQYRHIATGENLEDGDYPILIKGSAGPQISDISVSMSADGGVTTNYQLRTFTKKNSEQLTKFNLDKIRRQGLDNLKGDVANIKDRLMNSFGAARGFGSSFQSSSAFNTPVTKAGTASALATNSSQTDPTIDSDIVRAKSCNIIMGQSKKSVIPRATDRSGAGEFLVQEGGNHKIGTAAEAGMIDGKYIKIESKNDDTDYPTKAFMSMDGLVRPVSVNGQGNMPQFYRSWYNDMCSDSSNESLDDANPRYTDPNYEGDTRYYSYQPFPPIVGSGTTGEAVPVGPSQTGLLHGDYNINISFLNPFTNPAGNFMYNGKNTSPDDEDSAFVGHDISLLSSKDNPEGRTRAELEAEAKLNSKSIDTAYQDDYRAMALRGPLLLHGWGYDLQGKPVPNYKDYQNDATLDQCRKGNFATTELHDYFAPGWLKKSHSWPVAPVDLRFDRARGVWVAPQPFKLVQVTLKEGIPNDELGYAAPAKMEKSLDGSDGTAVEVHDILVNSVTSQKYKKDTVVICSYDTDTCEYQIIEGQEDIDTETQCRPTLAILMEDLGLSDTGSECTEVNTAEAFKLYVNEAGAEFAVNEFGQTSLAGEIDITDFTPHQDTVINITNSLKQPLQAGTKVIATNCFFTATVTEADSPGEIGSITETVPETEPFYRVIQAQFCPLVTLTSIYIREDYPCDFKYVYDNIAGPNVNHEGECGGEGTFAGGGIQICNRQAETQITMDINFCPAKAEVIYPEDGDEAGESGESGESTGDGTSQGKLSVQCDVPAECAYVQLPCCGETVYPPYYPEECDGYCYWINVKQMKQDLADGFGIFAGLMDDEDKDCLDSRGADYYKVDDQCVNGGECIHPDDGTCEDVNELTDEECQLAKDFYFSVGDCSDTFEHLEGYPPFEWRYYVCKIKCVCDEKPESNCGGRCYWIDTTQLQIDWHNREGWARHAPDNDARFDFCNDFDEGYKFLSDECQGGGRCKDPNYCGPQNRNDATEEQMEAVRQYLYSKCNEGMLDFWLGVPQRPRTGTDSFLYYLKEYVVSCQCDCEGTGPQPPKEPPKKDDCGTCLWVHKSWVENYRLGMAGEWCMGNPPCSPIGGWYLVSKSCSEGRRGLITESDMCDQEYCVLPNIDTPSTESKATNCVAGAGDDIGELIDWLDSWCCWYADRKYEGPQWGCRDATGLTSKELEDLDWAVCRTACDCDEIIEETPDPPTPYTPRRPSPLPSPTSSTFPEPEPDEENFLMAEAATAFCFDIEAEINYPTYPELRIDVGERVIYLQARWSRVLGSIDRQALDLDVQDGDGNVPNMDANFPNMPTFNSRKTNHINKNKDKTKTSFNAESGPESLISSYAAEELAGKYGALPIDAQRRINIVDFDGGFADVQDDNGCCTSFFDNEATLDRLKGIQAGEGGRKDVECPGGFENFPDPAKKDKPKREVPKL